MKKLTNEEYIKKANIKHNNKYSYEKLEYISSTKKVKITCKEHGDFEQEANSHIRGIGCPSCSGNNKPNINEWIIKCNLIHNNKYDYSLVNYVNAKKKVKIICPIHGEFEQSPNNHIYLHGCSECGIEKTIIKNTKSSQDFIEKSNLLHNNKYDYSLVNYVNAKKKVKIICPIHGEFEQYPTSHLNGSSCRICGFEKISVSKTKNKDTFILESNIVHNSKYDYSLVNYIGTDIKVQIICPKHGSFYQKCSKHISGQGCPTCSESKLEKEVRIFLINNNIEFKQQYGRKQDTIYLYGQTLDFYLPEYKIAIECQGEQHFRPVDFGNKGSNYAANSFRKIIIRDYKKFIECKKEGIDILYYSKNIVRDYIDKIYSNLNNLLIKIKTKNG